MSEPFIIMGLPRSRTYWLAKFLSYKDWHCGHDQLQYTRSLEDVRAWLSQPCTGTSETAAAPFWRLLMHYAPDIKIVIVRRPVGEVMASIERAGISDDTGTIAALIRQHDRKLDQITQRVPGVLSVSFADLANEAVCARVFEHCLPYRHDHEWWAAWDKHVVSGDIIAQTRYAKANLPQILKLVATAKHRSLALMRPEGKPLDGFTFQEEDFDTWLRDGVHLFREHSISAGEEPDSYLSKNIPLFRLFSDRGYLQILTARSNGRMFGYQVAVISPTLESPDGTMASLNTFYASKDAPGLGQKLQRASLDLLRSKGVGEVFGRAGVRGDGHRLGALYRRQGFDDYGTLHRLVLQESISWGSQQQ